MDFNINNETFANAYKCLNDANVLLQNGLGNFDNLNGGALDLIGKSGVSNYHRLNNATTDCSDLYNKMYGTIELLSTIDIESAQYFNDILGGDFFLVDDDGSPKLNAPMGYNPDGPSGSETWYDLNMSAVVKNMEEKYGYSDLVYSIRGDGVKVLSGVTPDGERFENLVIVAADVASVANPNGTFERGQIVETSLGMGIVADYCGRSASQRKSDGTVHFDIATAWHTGEYMAAAYSDEPYLVSNDYFEQVVPGQNSTGTNSDGGIDTPVTSIIPEDIYYDDELVDITAESSSNLQSKNNTLIAHRGYHPGGIWENSADAFIAAGEEGFWGAEADVVYDSSGNLVVSHGTQAINSKTISIDEYLDICKEYGMTAIIDLKYDSNTNSEAYSSLGPEVAKIIEEKGMIDSCVIQTNHDNDVANIRASSDDVRIWMLGYNDVTDTQIDIALENNVECINFNNKNETTTNRNIEKISDAGLDTCVWNVWSESTKDKYIENGAKYVMSDNSLGISPYQEGDVDYNNVDV